MPDDIIEQGLAEYIKNLDETSKKAFRTGLILGSCITPEKVEGALKVYEELWKEITNEIERKKSEIVSLEFERGQNEASREYQARNGYYNGGK